MRSRSPKGTRGIKAVDKTSIENCSGRCEATHRPNEGHQYERLQASSGSIRRRSYFAGPLLWIPVCVECDACDGALVMRPSSATCESSVAPRKAGPGRVKFLSTFRKIYRLHAGTSSLHHEDPFYRFNRRLPTCRCHGRGRPAVARRRCRHAGPPWCPACHRGCLPDFQHGTGIAASVVHAQYRLPGRVHTAVAIAGAKWTGVAVSAG